ncbi:hypothetical protein [Streptomyces sp. ATCC 21386]|nr:hypothetical protein [Streptomyces sp. ATCC 21386]
MTFEVHAQGAVLSIASFTRLQRLSVVESCVVACDKASEGQGFGVVA